MYEEHSMGNRCCIVIEINLISASSLDSEQIIKALCVLIRLIFCLVGQKESR